MLADFVLELVYAVGTGLTITLPGVAPAGRVTWASRFTYTQPVFYVLDDTTQEEWGFGTFITGTPAQITRDHVLGNSLGTTARLNFTATTRCYSSWPAQPLVTALGANAGRNLFDNGLFNVNQRGAGPFTTNNAYTSDRWIQQLSTSTLSTTIIPLADADRSVIGDEEAASALQCVCGGTAGAADFALMSQRMEGTRRFAGKTLMVSFWARATAGTPSLGLEGVQNFGSGGTPTPNLTGISPTSIALSTAWQRFSVPIAMPSAAGATFGTTAGTDFSVINFWLSSGATNNSRAANIGVQSCTLQLWGMQCEIGSFANTARKAGSSGRAGALPASLPVTDAAAERELSRCRRRLLQRFRVPC